MAAEAATLEKGGNQEHHVVEEPSTTSSTGSTFGGVALKPIRGASSGTAAVAPSPTAVASRRLPPVAQSTQHIERPGASTSVLQLFDVHSHSDAREADSGGQDPSRSRPADAAHDGVDVIPRDGEHPDGSRTRQGNGSGDSAVGGGRYDGGDGGGVRQRKVGGFSEVEERGREVLRALGRRHRRGGKRCVSGLVGLLLVASAACWLLLMQLFPREYWFMCVSAAVISLVFSSFYVAMTLWPDMSNVYDLLVEIPGAAAAADGLMSRQWVDSVRVIATNVSMPVLFGVLLLNDAAIVGRGADPGKLVWLRWAALMTHALATGMLVVMRLVGWPLSLSAVTVRIIQASTRQYVSSLNDTDDLDKAWVQLQALDKVYRAARGSARQTVIAMAGYLIIMVCCLVVVLLDPRPPAIFVEGLCLAVPFMTFSRVPAADVMTDLERVPKVLSRRTAFASRTQPGQLDKAETESFLSLFAALRPGWYVFGSPISNAAFSRFKTLLAPLMALMMQNVVSYAGPEG